MLIRASQRLYELKECVEACFYPLIEDAFPSVCFEFHQL